MDILQQLNATDFKNQQFNKVIKMAADVIVTLLKKMIFQEIVLLRKTREIRRLQEQIISQQIQIDTMHRLNRLSKYQATSTNSNA